MSLPVFNPHKWALLFFPTGGLPYPNTPEDLFRPIKKGDAKSDSCVFCELVLMGDDGDYKLWEFGSPQGLLDNLEDVMRHSIVQSAGKLFTIHDRGMLQRLLHWNDLRKKFRDKPEPLISTPALVDLVEAFHFPSILTYAARTAFSVGEIRRWVDDEKIEHETFETEARTLTRLCQILN